MTAADINADCSNWTEAQCKEFYEIQLAEAMDRKGGNASKAGKSVENLFPSLMARKKFFADQAAQAIQNDDIAQRAAIPQLGTDVQDLYRGIDYSDMAPVWKACGNSFAPEKASVGFDKLVDLEAAKHSNGFAPAETRVRSKFKALAALADSQKLAAKLGVELPTENGGFSAKTGMHSQSPDPSQAKSLEFKNPFIVKQ